MSRSTSELRVRLAPLDRFKPSIKIFYGPFQGGTSFVDLLCFCSVLCLLCLCALLFICALWSPVGKGLPSWLSFVVSNCEFVTFPLVSWVRCGTWLYRFLIFALLLTFNMFFHTSAQIGISCIKCVLDEFWKTNFQNWQLTQLFIRYFKYQSLIKLITKYCIWVFCIQFSVAMNTVNPKIWCASCFQKVFQLECFIF